MSHLVQQSGRWPLCWQTFLRRVISVPLFRKRWTCRGAGWRGGDDGAGLAPAQPLAGPPHRCRKPGLRTGPCLPRGTERVSENRLCVYCHESCASSDRFWLFQNFFIACPRADSTRVPGEERVRPFGTHLRGPRRFLGSRQKCHSFCKTAFEL